MKRMSLKHRRCPACGKCRNTVLYVNSKYIVGIGDNQWKHPLYYVICKHCGCIYLNPCPVERDLNKFYSEAMITLPKEAKDIDYNSTAFKIFDRVMCTYMPDVNSVLEIGAGTSELLMYIKQKYDTANLRGVELSKPLVDYTREHYNLNIECIGFNEFKTTYKFDLIILDNVLEHFETPLDTLTKVNNLLADDGKVYIVVPYIMTPKVTIRDQFSAHPTNFMFQNLRLLMYRAGLWIESHRILFGSLVIRARVLNPTDVLPEFDFQGYTDVIKVDIGNILSRQREFNDKLLKTVRKLANSNSKILIYGAGEHTSDLLGRIKFKNLIGLVDGNIMYQGKQMNDYHIYAPSDIHTLNYDYILISSCSAELTIKRELLKLQVPLTKIITLYT